MRIKKITLEIPQSTYTKLEKRCKRLRYPSVPWILTRFPEAVAQDLSEEDDVLRCAVDVVSALAGLQQVQAAYATLRGEAVKTSERKQSVEIYCEERCMGRFALLNSEVATLTALAAANSKKLNAFIEALVEAGDTEIADMLAPTKASL